MTHLIELHNLNLLYSVATFLLKTVILTLNHCSAEFILHQYRYIGVAIYQPYNTRRNNEQGPNKAYFFKPSLSSHSFTG